MAKDAVDKKKNVSAPDNDDNELGSPPNKSKGATIKRQNANT